MIKPTTIGGFTLYVNPLAAGPEYVARENNTGIEKKTRVADAQAGNYESAFDGRYVMLLADGSQGKHGQDDLILAVFDTGSKNFVSFQVPADDLYHTVSGPANPQWLWVKNGGSQPNTYPGDPGGALGPYRFVSPTEVEWVTTEVNTSGLVIKYILWRRTFSPATGVMEAAVRYITEAANDPAAPTEPSWY